MALLFLALIFLAFAATLAKDADRVLLTEAKSQVGQDMTHTYAVSYASL